MSQPAYTAEVGRKFHADGRVRRFPGNTIVSMVDPASPAYRAGLHVQEQLARQPYGGAFVALPPSSLHMTVMELLCDEVRLAERWARGLPLDAPLAETDAFFMRAVPAIPAPPSFQMRYERLSVRQGILIGLRPADAASEAAIWDYRGALAEATGVRFPDHDDYQFHISLAYRLIQLAPAEQAALEQLAAGLDPILHDALATFTVGAPFLAFFDDMFSFLPVGEYGRLASRQ